MRIHLSRAATAALVIGIVATGGVHAQAPQELAPGAHVQGTPSALASVAAATQAASVPSASAGQAGESQPAGEAPLRTAVAQAAPNDPRWGLLAELAEHDFFLDAPLGRGQLYAFRWEEPGKMSMVTVVGLFSAKQIFELGEVPGEILLYYADHDKAKQNITHLKVAPDGTVRWGKDQPFLIRGEGESYFFTNHLKLVEAAPDSSAGRKAAKLIASGKLRAANRATTTSIAATPQGNSSQVPTAAATATPPPAPAVIETEVPRDFPIVWMRGLRLMEYPKGPMVIRGNADTGVGTIFTLVDGKPVTGVSDLLTRLGAVTDPKNVTITTVRPTHYTEYWVEATRLIDTPRGVLATAGYDTGLYLKKINDVAITSADQARAMLLEISKDLSKYKSKEVELPAPDEKEFVDAAVEAAKPKPSVAADLLSRWGAFAAFPGKVWYCSNSEPAEWFQRRTTNRTTSLPAARMTTAEWLDGGNAVRVYTAMGQYSWTDVVTLQPDGSFAMHSTGVSGFPELAGRMDKEGRIRFPLGTYKYYGSTYTDDIVYVQYNGYPTVYMSHGGSMTESVCQMQEYEEIKAPRFARELQYAREQAAEWAESQRRTDEYTAQLRAEGEQMVADMRADAMAEIARIPVVAEQVSQQRAELERLRVAAEQETAMRQAAERAAAEAKENARRAADVDAYQQAVDTQQKEGARSEREAAAAARDAQLAQAEADATRRREEEQRRREAEQQRRQEEARRPVAFREGVTLCKINRGKEWRCDGPLQVSYGNIDEDGSVLNEACGANTARELGVVGGYRAFGCGFGIHPTNRDYPGNRDVPAMLGLYIPNRATYYCPTSTSAYCRGR